MAALRLINLHVVEVIRCWLPRFRSQQLSGSSYLRQHARLSLRVADPFWQARYYDFNVWSERKFIEKLRYIHRNLVTRGLVVPPEDWVWSSFRHYANGEEGSSQRSSRSGRRETERGQVSSRQYGSMQPRNGPAQAKLGRAPSRVRMVAFRPGRPPARALRLTRHHRNLVCFPQTLRHCGQGAQSRHNGNTSPAQWPERKNSPMSSMFSTEQRPDQSTVGSGIFQVPQRRRLIFCLLLVLATLALYNSVTRVQFPIPSQILSPTISTFVPGSRGTPWFGLFTLRKCRIGTRSPGSRMLSIARFSA